MFAGTVLVPTTTLSAETGNNTSAANSFSTQTNGNIGAGNVSKAPISSLLYPGATTKVYAHFMPWFGANQHMNVGYKSADPTQVKAQVTDMLSRGISGMIVDWYGPGSYEDSTTQYVKTEAESRGGQFEFAVMEDAGAVSGCTDCTTAIINDLTYVYTTYEGSSAYMRWNGNPVVFFFGVGSLPVNWATVHSSLPGNPIFIFQNSGAFTFSQSGGGFSWVEPETVTSTDLIGAGYLADFYQTAEQYSAELPFGAGYKGFNDVLAAWSANRYVDQQCGQTWLQTLAEIGKFYSSTRQLPRLQLVTWNDYEEGTEIETGIDNCVSINASVSGSTVNWSISGNENTIDHYTLFISADGTNLMPLGDYPAGTGSADLSPFGFSTGTYQVYVKAVGKPSMVNHMSSAAAFTASGTVSSTAPPDFLVASSQSSVSVASGSSANVTIDLTPQGNFSGTISLACSGLPAGATCSFSPTSVALQSTALPVSVTISTASTHALNHVNASSSWLYAITFPAFGAVFVGMGQAFRRRRKLLAVSLAILMVVVLAGCGAAGNLPGSGNITTPTTTSSSNTTPTTTAPAATAYTVTITASSGSLQHTTALTLELQ